MNPTLIIRITAISVFAFLYNREKFSAQSKGLFLRTNCKMRWKKISTCDFFSREIKKRKFRQFQLCLKFRIHCSLSVNPDWPIFSIWDRSCSSLRPCCISRENICNLRNNARQQVCFAVFCHYSRFHGCRDPRIDRLHKLSSCWNRWKYWLMFLT